MSLAYAIFAIFFISTLPQLQQTIQTGETRDLNRLNLVLNTIGNLLLGIHAYSQGDLGITALGFYFVGYYAILLYYKSKEYSQ